MEFVQKQKDQRPYFIFFILEFEKFGTLLYIPRYLHSFYHRV